MSQLEALTITALGMAVVFIGLVACIFFIQLIGRLAGRVHSVWFRCLDDETPSR